MQPVQTIIANLFVQDTITGRIRVTKKVEEKLRELARGYKNAEIQNISTKKELGEAVVLAWLGKSFMELKQNAKQNIEYRGNDDENKSSR